VRLCQVRLICVNEIADYFRGQKDAEVRPLHAAKRKIEQEGWIVENQGKVERAGVRYGDFLTSKVVGNFVDTDKLLQRAKVELLHRTQARRRRAKRPETSVICE
jgi:hypothetical protein